MLAAPAPTSLVIHNDGDLALECQVLAAHWYALPARSLPPGGALRVALEPAGDALTLPGGLPVERIFCGIAGAAWLTRSELDLAAVAARPEVTCRAAGTDRVVCR